MTRKSQEKINYADRIPVDPQAFAAIIRTQRLEHQWSQEDLAYQVTTVLRQITGNPTDKITASWIRMAERGDPRLVRYGRLVALAEVFDVPLTAVAPAPQPLKTPTGAAPSPTAASADAELIVAFRKYGMQDADIQQLLPVIRQFARSAKSAGPKPKIVLEHMTEDTEDQD